MGQLDKPQKLNLFMEATESTDSLVAFFASFSSDG